MLHACWDILIELAPWLLLGMALAGVLHVILPASLIRRNFRGPWGVVKAVSFGVPLPLCSCGVIPAGIGMRNDGADDGAAVGFLISTPQTGVDSVLVSLSFFGWPFAIFKMVSALLLGVLGGWLTNWSASRRFVETTTATQSNSIASGAGELPVISGTPEPANDCCDHGEHAANRNWLVGSIKHALEVFRSIWLWLLIGILVSAAINAYLPSAWMQRIEGSGRLPAMLIVLTIALPLYVCATASVPIAAALVTQGFPLSAAMVFLMAGPASNLSTVGAIYGRFGIRPLLIYLTVVFLGSLAGGYFFDWLIPAGDLSLSHISPGQHHHAGGWLANASAIIVLVLMCYCAAVEIPPFWASLCGRSGRGGASKSDKTCCSK